MSRSSLRFLIAGLFVTGAGALVAATPAFACHEPTGMCCIDSGGYCAAGHPFCCMFINNVLQPETCQCYGQT